MKTRKQYYLLLAIGDIKSFVEANDRHGEFGYGMHLRTSGTIFKTAVKLSQRRDRG